MTAQWILGWWNLIFMVPFALALMYLVLYTVSGITFGEADADADVEPALETRCGCELMRISTPMPISIRMSITTSPALMM